jgi:predicted transcriptional regulator
MYRANLSHEQLESYLHFLLEEGLIEQVVNGSDRPRFIITDKGLEAKKMFLHVSNYMSVMYRHHLQSLHASRFNSS